MERVQVLIDKLVQQMQQNESAAHLLYTVQLLQNELQQAVQKTAPTGKSKVAVVMPAGNYAVPAEPAAPAIKNEPVVSRVEKEIPASAPSVVMPAAVTAPHVIAHSIPAPVVEKKVEPVAETPAPVTEAEAPRQHAPQKDLFGNEIYSLKRPSVFTLQDEETTAAPEPAPVPKEVEKPAPQPAPFTPPVPTEAEHQPFNAIAETPTLVQYIEPQKEINQVVSPGQQPSLNDRLKQERSELANVLKDTPVKDLRKAIGINDKFLFVQELFRGDEAMYERSIKTINGFHILQEAEYWMNRELKVKLGWNDNKDTVQHFYALVRRRFS